MSRYLLASVMLHLLALAACTPHEALRVGAVVGNASGAVIETACTQAYLRAAEGTPEHARAEVARLDAMQCPRAAAAHDALRAAHDALAALVQAHAGEVEIAQAAAEVLRAAKELQAAVEAMQ